MTTIFLHRTNIILPCCRIFTVTHVFIYYMNRKPSTKKQEKKRQTEIQQNAISTWTNEMK